MRFTGDDPAALHVESIEMRIADGADTFDAEAIVFALHIEIAPIAREFRADDRGVLRIDRSRIDQASAIDTEFRTIAQTHTESRAGGIDALIRRTEHISSGSADMKVVVIAG